MPEARSSWNTLYQTKEGFECQITLRDEDENGLLDRAIAMVATLMEEGNGPVRRGCLDDSEAKPATKEEPPPEEPAAKPEKTYLDDKGVRRCNLKLKSGRRCNTVVVEREGRYGRFWSCTNFREHAP